MIVAGTVIGGVLCALGGLACVTSAVGVLRFPDFYTRLHAAGVGDTLGVGLVIAGLLVASATGEHGWVTGLMVGDLHLVKVGLLLSAKLLFILTFVWITGTTACHALAKSAWTEGVQPWRKGGTPSKP